MDIRVDVDSVRVREAFAKAPAAMSRTLDGALNKAATYMVRTAQDVVRSNGSIFRSLLVQSMFHRTPEPLVREVRSSMHYAAYVEHGTRAGGMPPVQALQEWLRIRHSVVGKDAHNRAFMLAKHIQKNGTKKKPFMQPAFEQSRSRLELILKDGVARGVESVLGA
ncbi:hypothetical protein DTO96_102520 [Ephemeroptericola cinctiostellae]|uniref:HK97 gp10 family phage protein n=1 Tax=Ephemeroptericola cinctiostellae TaxID=2268024 RepID=A0A345DEH6_9BURK|nr:HK97 gp10 family phage protein [Ephemeroptericola cinctiostellae]AXF86764.1 hypothetical protein DTO96_102520 [Ephemeroptericola cinctiostellae]